MSDTPLLAITELEQNQASAYLTFNEALRKLEAAINLTVLEADRTSPPGGESEGDRYIVGGTGTGAWAGQDQNIAVYIGGGWEFFPPETGWRAYDQENDLHLYFDGTDWTGALSPNVINVPARTNANRGTAPSDGTHPMIFNTDDGYPNWGDGSGGWVEADGTST